ncbi:hypothetical protein GCM10027051_04270 [Niabella terrae]
MTANYYITAHSRIVDRQLWSGDRLVFETTAAGLDWLHAAYDALEVGYPKFYKMDLLCKSGMIACDVVFKEQTPAFPEQTGLVLSNHSGSIEADINYYKSVAEIPSPALFVYTLPNILIGEISIRYQLKGENAFFVQEAFNASWLHEYITGLLENQGMQACLGGWVEVEDQQPEAFIFYVEKVKRPGSLNFTPQNLDHLYSK